MKTQKIPIAQAAPGMIVADDVYTFNNQLIISAGMSLTDKMITRLKFYSIKYILISLSEDDNISPSPFIRETYSERIKNTVEFKQFNEQLINTSDQFKSKLNDIIVDQSKEINTDELLKDVGRILTNVRNGIHMFDMLHCMREYDDETYVHSINVALICNILGRWLHFDRKDLDTVTLCGLLHDIGKILTPHELITKPGILSADEYETVKLHTLKGYNVLREKKLNIHVQMSAMMHHERCDGSGYPMGIKADQIDPMAKVVMIADVYDAMTSARVYRGPLCPFEVIHIFESDGLIKFDPKCIMTFLDHVNSTYLGYRVRLSDQREGTIIMMDRNNMSKPVIECGNQYVDLAKENNLFIQAIL